MTAKRDKNIENTQQIFWFFSLKLIERCDNPIVMAINEMRNTRI